MTTDELKYSILAVKIKEQLTITDILADHNIKADLNKNIKCPLGTHEDKNPSFSVIDNKSFNCFSCQVKGSLIKLEEILSNSSNEQAIESIALTHNIALDKHYEEYFYYDAFGKEIFRVRKYTSPKRFVQGHVKDDVWVSKLPTTQTSLPYRLNQWYIPPNQSDLASDILIVEGEKDVHNIEALGFIGTCNAGGAGKFNKNHASYLEGRNIVIIPDNDDAGKLHTAGIIQACKEHRVKSIKIINLDGLQEKGDVADWIPLQKDPQKELTDLINSTPTLTQAEIASYYTVKVDMRSITSGNKSKKPKIKYYELAELFASENMQDGMFLYKKFNGQWFFYSKKSYKTITTDDLKNKITSFLKDYSEANKEENLNPSISTRDNVIAMLESDKLAGVMSYTRMPIWLDDKKENGMGWTVLDNNIINIKTLAMRENGNSFRYNEAIRDHTPKFFSSIYLNYKYDPLAECPLWDKFLSTSLDPENVKTLQMMFGLCLIPDVTYQVFFLLFGTPGGGKSTALDVLRSLVGSQNCSAISPLKMEDKFSSIALTTKLVNIVGELPDAIDFIKVENHFNDVVSGALIETQMKFKDISERTVTVRNVFASNYFPRFSSRNKAVLERMRIIPFNKAFRGTPEQINDLSGKIHKKELSGVLNWAIKGLAMLLKSGATFEECEQGKKIKQEEHFKIDNEARFIDESCEVMQGMTIKDSALYDAYKQYCFINGNGAMSKVHFIDRVKGVDKRIEYKRHNTHRFFNNLRLV